MAGLVPDSVRPGPSNPSLVSTASQRRSLSAPTGRCPRSPAAWWCRYRTSRAPIAVRRRPRRRRPRRLRSRARRRPRSRRRAPSDNSPAEPRRCDERGQAGGRDDDGPGDGRVGEQADDDRGDVPADDDHQGGARADGRRLGAWRADGRRRAAPRPSRPRPRPSEGSGSTLRRFRSLQPAANRSSRARDRRSRFWPDSSISRRLPPSRQSSSRFSLQRARQSKPGSRPRRKGVSSQGPPRTTKPLRARAWANYGAERDAAAKVAIVAIALA